jgi:hypothetical protein
MRSPGWAALTAEWSSELEDTDTRRECGIWVHAVVVVVGGGGGGAGAGAGAGAGCVVVPELEPVTAIAADLLFPSAVAVIDALPTATPVTKPLVETAATGLLELDHVTVPPVTAFPSASWKEAASCSVRP